MHGQDDVEFAVLVDGGRQLPPQFEPLLVIVLAVANETELLLRVEFFVAATESLQLEHRDAQTKMTDLGVGKRGEGRKRREKKEEGRLEIA